MGPLGMQAAGAALNAGMGLALGAIQDQRQVHLQGRLQQMQIAGQKEMADYMGQKQLELWDKTNYSAQKEHMKKAGLNPALMYGMGGGGGATAAAASGNVSGGNASGHSGEVAAMMGMGLQRELLEAQKKVLESQANLNNTEAEKKAGVDTKEAETRINSLMQGIENAKAQEQMQKVETRLKEMSEFEQKATQEDRIDYIAYQTKRALTDLENAENETFINTQTKNEKITIIQQAAVEAMLKNALLRVQKTKTETEINLDNKKIEEISASILQKWATVEQGNQKLAIDAFKAEVDANYPGVSQVIGRAIDDGLEKIFQLLPKGFRPITKQMPK